MPKYTYAGAMTSEFPSNAFVTSLFKKGKKYFVQVEDGEKIKKFEETIIVRKILKPQEPIFAKENDDYIYSFITEKNELLSGARKDIELKLLRILNEEYLNVYTKLIISSFLKFYQRTLELAGDSDLEFKKLGIEQEFSNEFPFSESIERETEVEEIRGSMLERYRIFNQVDHNVRYEDIAFLKGKKLYFFHFKMKVEMVINSNCLRQDDQNKMISGLIMNCIKTNKNIIHTLLLKYSETYEFILFSRHIRLEQRDIESLISPTVRSDETDVDASILEIGMVVDKEIHNSYLNQSEDEFYTEHEVQNLESNTLSLENSFKSIVQSLAIL
jgi:hypothetical protein